MRKKIRLAQNKDDLGSDDRLSRLSDDILVSILSYLPLKDAVVTSKLSRRWRYVWCQTVHLDFEDKERSKQLLESYMRDFKQSNNYINLRFAERNKYINWVNRIIRQHKNPTIDRFRICFNLDKNGKGAIGKWIEFAISKNVQTLELDLSDNRTKLSNYVFPNKIFDRKCGSSSKQPSINVSVTPYATTMGMKFLKALILKCVDVNDEGLKKILSNCLVLEHLSIHGSTKLVEVKIRGKGLALKKLEFGGLCSMLDSIEICDSNIVSLSCMASNCRCFPITLRLDNLEKLENISIGKAYLWRDRNHMFCHLQALELDLYSPKCAIELLLDLELPELKQLIMKVGVRDDDNLLVFTSLLEGFPNLQRFKIELMWYSWMRPRGSNREVMQSGKQPNQHLEVVEICGYYGLPNDLELAMYFMENVVALKKLVIQPFMKVARLGTNIVIEENGARYNAHQQLEPRTPVGVELVIL